MATEVLRLGVDPGGAERGFARYNAAASGAAASSTRVATTVAAVGAAMAAFATARQIGAAVGGMIEFDQAMTQSLAIMGDVDEAMRNRMATSARKVGEDLNFAATEGAEAFFFLASAGLDAEQQLAALPAVAEFARAGMFDFSTATDLATDAQSALGLTVEDAQQNLQNMTRVTDVLVKANTLANASVEQFATSLTTEAAAAMKTFNIDVEEGTAVLAAFADQGIKGQRAGSGFSRMLRIMSTAAAENSEDMDRLGLSFTDSQDRLLPMADIVEQLTDVFGDMGVEQRAAELNAIGFTARVQQMIFPLLGTADAIREYEAGLRDAAGTTKEVSDNQMQSMENRIGQIRQEFVNWRTEMAEGAVPAIEAAIEHVDVLVDAMKTLVTVAGAAGAVAAFNALSPAITTVASNFVFLAGSATSLSNALVALQLAIGPTGWLVLGLSAAAATGFTLTRMVRETTEALDEHEQALNSTRQAMAALNEEQAKATLSGLGQQLAEAQAAVRGIEAQLQGTSGQFATARLETELDAANRKVEELESLILSASQRWVEFGRAAQEEAAGAAKEVEETWEQALERMLGEQQDATLVEKLIGDERIQEKALANLHRTLDRLHGSLSDLNEIEITIVDPEDIVRLTKDTEDAARESAQTFEDEWVAAISVVGGAMGGLASQVASIATAFATGGPASGFAALFGAGIGMLQGGDDAEVQAQNRLNEAAQEAAEALSNVARAANEFSDLQSEAVESFGDAVQALADAQTGGFDIGAERFAEIEGQLIAMARAGADAGEIIEFLTQRFRLNFEAVEGLEGAIEEFSLAVERIAEQMEQRAREVRADFGARAAELGGNDIEALRIRRIAAANQEAAQLEKLWRAGVLTADEFERFVGILQQEVVQALQDAAEEARQFRVALAEDLNVRALRAQGLDQQAAVAALEAQHRRELLEIQEQAPSMVDQVRAVQELERQALLQQQEVAAQTREIQESADRQIAAYEDQTRVVREQLAVSRDRLRVQERQVNDLRNLLQSLDRFATELVAGPNTPLSPTRRLEAARAEFETLRALAMSGDVSAGESLPDAAQNFLDASREVNASSVRFFEDFVRVQGTLESLETRFGRTLTVEERMLEQLQAQNQRLEAQLQQLRAAAQQARADAQRQIDKLSEQIAEEKKTNETIRTIVPPPLPPPGGGGGTPDIPLRDDAVAGITGAVSRVHETNAAGFSSLRQELQAIRSALANQTGVLRTEIEGLRVGGGVRF